MHVLLLCTLKTFIINWAKYVVLLLKRRKNPFDVGIISKSLNSPWPFAFVNTEKSSQKQNDS